MTLEQIKNAVKNGLNVRWMHHGYTVECNNEQWLITCSYNNSSIDLMRLDGVTLNGKESEFYIEAGI